MASDAHPQADRFELEGLHCTLAIAWPAPGIALVTISGTDTGEFADLPFRELERGLTGPVEQLDLFIDGRDTRGASIDVSNDWAAWLSGHRERLQRVTMLTGSRFIRMTAEFVRQFADLGEIMRVTTDLAAFDAELGAAVAGAQKRRAGSQRR
jgi:hypothetical protein